MRAAGRSPAVSWTCTNGWLWGALAVVTLLAVSMIDVVHVEGDHTSYLVIAPGPTLGFVHGGGEEGAFRRSHPSSRVPWWLRGEYLVLCELTDG